MLLVLAPAAYMAMWALAMGSVTAGVWPLAAVAGIVMLVLAFRAELRRAHKRVRG